MPSWLEALRMRNNFDPEAAYQQLKGEQNMPDYNVGMEATDMPDQSGPVMKGGGFDYGAPPTGMAAYQPEHTASDRFNDLIKNYPEDQKPSFLRTIAASLSAFGAGGPKAGQEVMDEPNVSALRDWKNQVGPAQQAANLERQENINSRNLAYQTEQTKLGQAKLDEKAKTDEERTRISSKNASTRRMLAENPNFKAMDTKGGNIQLYDSKTGDTIDTGVKSGELDEETSLKIKQRNAMEQIGERGDIESRHIVERGGVAEHLLGIPKAKAPGTGTGKAESPAQRRTRLYNNAQEALARHPDWAPYIDLEGAGTFSVKPPVGDAWVTRGKTPDTVRKQIIASIYGNEPETNQSAVSIYDDAGNEVDENGGIVEQPPTPPEPSQIFSDPHFGELGGVNSGYTPNPKYANSQRVKVIGPDGKQGDVPQEQLQQAIAKGYKPVDGGVSTPQSPVRSVQKPQGRLITHYDPKTQSWVRVPEVQAELADRQGLIPVDYDAPDAPVMNLLRGGL